MANAYKCDRCEEYSDGNPDIIMEFPSFQQNPIEDNPRKVYLCESCGDKLAEFIGGRGLNPLKSISVEFEPNDVAPAGYWSQPDHPMDTRCSFTATFKPTKNLLGDAERAEGALDEMIDMGARNY